MNSKNLFCRSTVCLRSVFFATVVFTWTNPTVFAASPLVIYPTFRVETDIFEGDATAPQSQHLILFDSGVVYDLPVGNGTKITVFDVPRGRVMLLDKATRVRTSISTDTLIQKTAQLRAMAAEDGGGEALGLNAKITPGETTDSVTLKFGSARYTVTSQAVTDSTIAAEFASFTAWASRLNSVCRIGSPPFARITLADYLAAENRIPQKLTLEVRQLLKTRTLRSEHSLVERLSDLDRRKISEVGGFMATYEEVDFSQFPND